jgi:hypothetical protein
VERFSSDNASRWAWASGTFANETGFSAPSKARLENKRVDALRYRVLFIGSS